MRRLLLVLGRGVCIVYGAARALVVGADKPPRIEGSPWLDRQIERHQKQLREHGREELGRRVGP